MIYWFFSQWHQNCLCLQTIHFIFQVEWLMATLIYRASKVWFNGVLLLCLAQFLKYFSQFRHTSMKLTARIIQIYNRFLDYRLLCIDIPRGKQRLRLHFVTQKAHILLSAQQMSQLFPLCAVSEFSSLFYRKKNSKTTTIGRKLCRFNDGSQPRLSCYWKSWTVLWRKKYSHGFWPRRLQICPTKSLEGEMQGIYGLMLLDKGVSFVWLLL